MYTINKFFGKAQIQGQQIHQVLQRFREGHVTYLAIPTLMIGAGLIKKVIGGVLQKMTTSLYTGAYSTIAMELTAKVYYLKSLGFQFAV